MLQNRERTIAHIPSRIMYVISIINGKTSQALVGRKQLGEAFAGFLSLFETVYHLNGQQTVNIHGNSAT